MSRRRSEPSIDRDVHIPKHNRPPTNTGAVSYPMEGAVPYQIEEELSRPIEVALANRATVNPHEPATLEDMLEVWARIDRFKSEARANRKSEANQLLQIQNQPKVDAERLKALEWKVKILWGLLITALSLAGGSVFSITKYLYSSGGDSREAAINMKILVDRSLDNQKRIQFLERYLPSSTKEDNK